MTESSAYLNIPGTDLHFYLMCKDGKLISTIFEEIKKSEISIDSITVRLPCAPEKIPDSNTERVCLGYAHGSRTDGYTIGLFPKTIEKYKKNYERHLRRATRHELAHIKYGDCDRSKPTLLHLIINRLIEEPRARIYALTH